MAPIRRLPICLCEADHLACQVRYYSPLKRQLLTPQTKRRSDFLLSLLLPHMHNKLSVRLTNSSFSTWIAIFNQRLLHIWVLVQAAQCRSGFSSCFIGRRSWFRFQLGPSCVDGFSLGTPASSKRHSIHSLNPPNPFWGHRIAGANPATVRQRQGTVWTGCQSVTGHTHANMQS